MATAELHTTDEPTTASEWDADRRNGEVVAEWLLVSTAMVGAVCGALAGVGVSGLVFPAAEPTVLGSLGSIVGSLLAAAAGSLFARRG